MHVDGLTLHLLPVLAHLLHHLPVQRVALQWSRRANTALVSLCVFFGLESRRCFTMTARASPRRSHLFSGGVPRGRGRSRGKNTSTITSQYCMRSVGTAERNTRAQLNWCRSYYRARYTGVVPQQNRKTARRRLTLILAPKTHITARTKERKFIPGQGASAGW